MKTILAIDMLVKHFEQRVRDIKAETKEAYDKALNEAVDETWKLAVRISNLDPIILPIMPGIESQDTEIKRIASEAAKRTCLPPIYTDTTCNIGIQNVALFIPKYVNFSETPGVAIKSGNGWEEFAQQKMTHLLMCALLAMPVGKVRLHFIDLNFSGKAQFFIDNFDRSVCEVCLDVSSAERQAESLKEKMAQRLRGELSDDSYDFVVFLDFLNDYNKIGNAYSQIIEKGALANIHTIFINNGQNLEENVYNPILGNEDRFCPIDGYTKLPKDYKYDRSLTFAALSFAKDSDFRRKCIDYLNSGVQQDDETPKIDETEYAVTTSVIEVPIGKTANGETVEFKMDVNRGHYHAFVIGETGSGKSRFLHDIIINMIAKYSPEDVELYLMDFKGVEFNPYRDIKHSRVILVDRADERITYEVIRELQQKMEERQKILAAAGASDVDEFNKMSADKHISQIILVADECQTLFSDDAKNNKLQRDMIATIALIAQQGRAYGVHLLLATQSLSNAAPTPPLRYAHISDTMYMPELAGKIGPVDLLFHETTYLEEHKSMAAPRGHSTARQAAMVARDAGAKRLLTGHYSSRYNDFTLFKREAEEIFPHVILNNEGLSVPLD